MGKPGKYAHVIAKLPRHLGTEPKYQEKVDAVKAAMLRQPCDCDTLATLDLSEHAEDCASHQAPRKFIPGNELAKGYADVREEIRGIEAVLAEANLRLEAIEQLLINQFEVEGVTSVSLADFGVVRTQYEPYAKVVDKEKFRQWCIDTCTMCGQPASRHPFVDTASGQMCERPITLETSLALPWASTNSIVKERLLAGESEPDGIQTSVTVKAVFTRQK